MNIRTIAGKIGMDYDNILEDFCGDVSALGAKLDSFTSEDYEDKLSKLLEDANYDEIKAIAHKTRNASEKLGLNTLAKAARHVEDADLDKIKNATVALIEKLNELKAIVNKDKENQAQ